MLFDSEVLSSIKDYSSDRLLGYQEATYRVEGNVVTITLDCYNGAMSTT